MRATIDQAGRLVIPKAIRDRLGLGPGIVDVVVDGTGIRVEPIAGATLSERDARHSRSQPEALRPGAVGGGEHELGQLEAALVGEGERQRVAGLGRGGRPGGPGRELDSREQHGHRDHERADGEHAGEEHAGRAPQHDLGGGGADA